MYNDELLKLIEELKLHKFHEGYVTARIEHSLSLVGALVEAAPPQPQLVRESELPPLRISSRKRTTVVSRREFVLAWGAEHESFSPKDLAQATGANLSSIRSTFSVLKGEGIIVSLGEGLWTLRARRELAAERKIG